MTNDDPYVKFSPLRKAKKKQVRRTYHRPEHLLAIYRYIEAYREENKLSPSVREIQKNGFASSTSVVRYYLDRMEEFKMIERHKIRIGDTLISPARAIHLLPLSKSHSAIQELLKKENTHE